MINKVTPHKGVKVTKLIKEEIDIAYKKLWRFAEGRAYDSGVRNVPLEFYIKGLEKAKRLVDKQIRLNKSL